MINTKSKRSESSKPIASTNDRLRNTSPASSIKLGVKDYFPDLLNVDRICKGSILNLL